MGTFCKSCDFKRLTQGGWRMGLVFRVFGFQNHIGSPFLCKEKQYGAILSKTRFKSKKNHSCNEKLPVAARVSGPESWGLGPGSKKNGGKSVFRKKLEEIAKKHFSNP